MPTRPRIAPPTAKARPERPKMSLTVICASFGSTRDIKTHKGVLGSLVEYTAASNVKFLHGFGVDGVKKTLRGGEQLRRAWIHPHPRYERSPGFFLAGARSL